MHCAQGLSNAKRASKYLLCKGLSTDIAMGWGRFSWSSVCFRTCCCGGVGRCKMAVSSQLVQ